MENFVEGNYEDKYNSKNPISKSLVKNFLNNFENLLKYLKFNSSIKTICEVGVGEGKLLQIASKIFPKAKLYGCDLSPKKVIEAQSNLNNKAKIIVQNAEKLTKYSDNQFDLVIACEILEHLNNPKKGLKEINRISKRHILLSVPHEPFWRLANLVRFKYTSSLGDTPGHINHWSSYQFSNFIKELDYDSQISKTPFPWQMKLINLEKDFSKKLQRQGQEFEGLLSPFLRRKRYKQVNKEITTEGKVLDVGCGAGEFAKFAHIKKSQYIGADIKRYSHNINFIKTDLSKKIPKKIKSKKFQYILLVAVIEHIKNYENLLINLKKLLDKKGAIIITTPHPITEFIHNLGSKLGLFSQSAEEEHEKLFDLQDFKSLAKKTNFKIIKYKRFLFFCNQLIILQKRK